MKSILLVALTLCLTFTASRFKQAYLYAISDKYVHKVKTMDGTASAFHISYKNKVYLLTNRHVCTSKDFKFVNIKNKEGKVIGVRFKRELIDLKEVIIGANKVKVLKINKKGYDLCLLEAFKTDGLHVAKLRHLEPLYSTGHPYGLPHLMKELHIIGQTCDPLNKSIFCKPVYIADKSTYGGTSGSPIIDLLGGVIGIVYAGNTAATFVIPIQAAIDFIESIDG